MNGVDLEGCIIVEGGGPFVEWECRITGRESGNEVVFQVCVVRLAELPQRLCGGTRWKLTWCFVKTFYGFRSIHCLGCVVLVRNNCTVVL